MLTTPIHHTTTQLFVICHVSCICGCVCPAATLRHVVHAVPPQYHSAYLTSGCFSPTRAGVFFVTRMDGVVDIWDYFYRQNEVAYSHKVGACFFFIKSKRAYDQNAGFGACRRSENTSPPPVQNECLRPGRLERKRGIYTQAIDPIQLNPPRGQKNGSFGPYCSKLFP